MSPLSPVTRHVRGPHAKRSTSKKPAPPFSGGGSITENGVTNDSRYTVSGTYQRPQLTLTFTGMVAREAIVRPFIGALLAALLVPTSLQQAPSTSGALSVDEGLRLLPGPGVYLDSPGATPRLVQIRPAAPKEIKVQVKRDPEPVVAQYPGPHASVRITATEPGFYVYMNVPDVLGPNKDKPDV